MKRNKNKNKKKEVKKHLQIFLAYLDKASSLFISEDFVVAKDSEKELKIKMEGCTNKTNYQHYTSIFLLKQNHESNQVI